MIDVRFPVAGVETNGGSLADRIIVNVRRLSDLPLDILDRVVAVRYVNKSASSHIEVVCRIRGIHLVRVDALDFVEGSRSDFDVVRAVPDEAIAAYNTHPGTFQVSAFHPADLDTIDLRRVATVFVRFEHLLYRILTEDPDALADTEKLVGKLRTLLVDFQSRLLPTCRLVVRGLDARSDDAFLGDRFFSHVEPNPELGNHGARRWAADPGWLAVEARALSALDDRHLYAAPFVARVQDFSDLEQRMFELAPDITVIPFLETPGALAGIASYRTLYACVGLKDVAQFYFAADRGNEVVATMIDYLEPTLVDFVTRTVRKANSIGCQISVFQDATMLAAYAKTLKGQSWIPSLNAGEMNLIQRASNLHHDRER